MGYVDATKLKAKNMYEAIREKIDVTEQHLPLVTAERQTKGKSRKNILLEGQRKTDTEGEKFVEKGKMMERKARRGGGKPSTQYPRGSRKAVSRHEEKDATGSKVLTEGKMTRQKWRRKHKYTK